MTSASTYTDPRDFSKIQRLLHDAEAGALLTGQEQEQGGFRAVLDARPREICDHELVQPAPRRASTVRSPTTGFTCADFDPFLEMW